MIFTVKDNGKPLTVAYSGGTAFNFPSTVANFDTYIKSQSKMAAAAAAANATILMSNHSEFDSAHYEDQDARLAQARRAASLRARERGGGALFQGHRGMRSSGAAQADAAAEISQFADRLFFDVVDQLLLRESSLRPNFSTA